MEYFQHQGKSLLYLTVHPDGYSAEKDYPLVILLHGFGAHMGDLAGLAPAIDREGYVYACPNAPLAVEIGPGMTGYSWTPPRGTATPEDVQLTEGLLTTFFDEVMEQYHVPAGRVILGGFSQGGGLTFRCGLGRPEVFAGLVALSCSIREPDELRDSLPAQRTQPIFMAHGTHDEMVSVERASQARTFLEAEGYQLQYKAYPMGHEITQEVLDDLVPWMHQVLPPLR